MPAGEEPDQSDIRRPGARRVGLDIVRQIVGRVLNLALGIVVTALIARTLGDEDFGSWATIFAVVQVTGYLASFGLEQVAVRRAAADPEHEAEWIGALITLQAALAVPAVLVTIGVLLAVADSTEMRLAGVLVSSLILIDALGSSRALLQLRLRNDVNAAVELGQGIAWALAVGALAAAGAGLAPFAIAFVGTMVLQTIVQVVLSLRVGRISWRSARSRWPALARAGVLVGIAGALTVGYARIDQVLVFELAGDRDAGLYGAVYRVLERSEFLPNALMLTLFPIIAAAHPADPARVRAIVQRSMEYLAMASVPVLAFTIVSAHAITTFLFGGDYAEAAPALPVLMGAFVLISFGYLAGYLVIVLGLQARQVGVALAGLVFNVGLNLWLLPRYGFMAAAWVTLATEVLVLGLTMSFVLSRLGLRPRVARAAKATVAAAIMAGLVWLVQEIGAPLAAQAAVAAVVYPALLLAGRAVTVGELRALARREPPLADEAAEPRP